MNGAMAKAEEIAKEIPDSFITYQFRNPANVKIHYETTGPEIYEQTDGTVDILVSGVGTGAVVAPSTYLLSLLLSLSEGVRF